MNLAQQAINSHILDAYIAEYSVKMSQAKREERFRATARPYEAKYRKMLKETFSMQMDEVLFTLQWYKSKGIEDNIDWNKYRIIYNEFGQLLLEQIYDDWGSQEMQTLEVGISFDVKNPLVHESIMTRANKFSDSIVNTTRDWLHVVITENINLGPYGLEKKIRQLYPEMSKYRSVRIARSETIFAMNEGAERSYIQSGVVDQKRWICAHDERLCPICSYMDGKTINVGTNYFNQGESLTVAKPQKASDTLTVTFNYESISHPPIHPSCRCSIVPIIL